MALAADVFDEDDFPGADLPGLTVARGDLHAAVQIDDVLAARGGMPGEIVISAGFAKDDPGGWQARGKFAAVAFLDPFDLDIAPVGFTGVIDIDVVNPHRS